jgi:hypothetical protein
MQKKYIMNDGNLYNEMEVTKYRTEKGLDLPQLYGYLKTIQYTTRVRDYMTFIQNNIYLNPDHRTHLINMYSIACRRQMILRRAVWKYRMKRKPAMNTTDLYMNPIDPSHPTMMIYVNGTKYIFRIQEIQRTILTAIEMADAMFAVPVLPKNPYTGVPFSYWTLYRIYVCVRLSPVELNPLFKYFTDVGFNINLFLMKYECLLRERHIADLLRNLTPIEELFDVRSMIDLVNDRSNHNFPYVYPREVSRPWLKLYYNHLYSMSAHYRTYSLHQLINTIRNYMNNLQYVLVPLGQL